jgi:hypothetical protein
MAVTDDEYRVLRYQVEQQGRRLAQLERFSDVITSTQTVTTFDDNGKVAVKLGRVSSTGRYGVEVYDSSGNTKARFGKLADGTFGVEVSTGGATLVHLERIAFGSGFDEVSNQQKTSSTSATVLATTGPTVTVTVGNSGRAVVSAGAYIQSDETNQTAFADLFVDGTGYRTIGQVANNAGAGAIGANCFSQFEVSGLSSGPHTFTLKYGQSLAGATAEFAARSLLVQPY